MQKTRGKRDLNLGVQPVIQDVKHVGDEVWLLSENTKMRGDMANLKKMVIPNVGQKLKMAIGNALSNGIYLCYGGVDAINLHFSNVPIHTPFVELVALIKPGSQPNFELCMSLAVRDILLKHMNETLTNIAGDETCVITRKILSDWKAEGGFKGDYFTLRMVSATRCIVDFNHDVTLSTSKKQPFLEIRYLPDLKVTPFEKDGVYFLPFGNVVNDINVGVQSNPGPDWKYRSESLNECMSRTGTSLSYHAFQAMARVCFTGVTMKKMTIREAVVSLIDEAVSNAPQNNGGTLSSLKNELYDEINLHNNSAGLEKIVTFENFLRRSRLLGLIPPTTSIIGDIFDNAYNRTTFEEYKKTNLN